MSTYAAQRRLNLSGLGLSAGLALVLFFSALIAGLLVAFTPGLPRQQVMRLKLSERVVVLTLSPPQSEVVTSLPRAAKPVIDGVSIGEFTAPQSTRASAPPVRMVEDEDIADNKLRPSPPVTPVEDIVELPPKPGVKTIPVEVSVVVSETEPVFAPAMVSEPAPEATAPPIPPALPVLSDELEPTPYIVGALVPDEAAVMPGDETLLPGIEDSPLPNLPEALPPPIRSVYARPSDDSAGKPRIAVVVGGLGLGRAATMAAIKLPGTVTLAFASHARALQGWIDLARAAGHEILLDLPMEPENYPQVDPGPHALLTSLSDAENVERLGWHLNRADGYVGVTHNMGSRFTTSTGHMRSILAALKRRGLMFLDARTSANSVTAGLATAIGLPRAINNRFLDTPASRPAIDRKLDEIEHIARRVGVSVAVSHAYPVTIERLERWIRTLDGKSLALVPVSALADKQYTE